MKHFVWLLCGFLSISCGPAGDFSAKSHLMPLDYTYSIHMAAGEPAKLVASYVAPAGRATRKFVLGEELTAGDERLNPDVTWSLKFEHAPYQLWWDRKECFVLRDGVQVTSVKLPLEYDMKASHVTESGDWCIVCGNADGSAVVLTAAGERHLEDVRLLCHGFVGGAYRLGVILAKPEVLTIDPTTGELNQLSEMEWLMAFADNEHQRWNCAVSEQVACYKDQWAVWLLASNGAKRQISLRETPRSISTLKGKDRRKVALNTSPWRLHDLAIHPVPIDHNRVGVYDRFLQRLIVFSSPDMEH